MRSDNSRKVLAECSFREFYNSPFMDDFIRSENGQFVFGGEGAKMVEMPCEGSMYDNDVLYVFYRRAPQRWVRKLEVSEPQMAEDCVVSLEGDGLTGDPEAIMFDVGFDTFEFILTKDMIRELRAAEEDKFIDEYFPGWNSYSGY